MKFTVCIISILYIESSKWFNKKSNQISLANYDKIIDDKKKVECIFFGY